MTHNKKEKDEVSIFLFFCTDFSRATKLFEKSRELGATEGQKKRPHFREAGFGSCCFELHPRVCTIERWRSSSYSKDRMTQQHDDRVELGQLGCKWISRQCLIQHINIPNELPRI